MKEARLDLRLDPEAKASLEQAAKLAHESTSAFVLHAAMDKADRLLTRGDTTIMPAQQFDELLSALDVADEAPALTELNQRQRRYERK